jgi:hypothetical protein
VVADGSLARPQLGHHHLHHTGTCTVKRLAFFTSRKVTNQTLTSREQFNYSRPGRVWLVTSRLWTVEIVSLFYSVVSAGTHRDYLLLSVSSLLLHSLNFLLYFLSYPLIPFFSVVYSFWLSLSLLSPLPQPFSLHSCSFFIPYIFLFSSLSVFFLLMHQFCSPCPPSSVSPSSIPSCTHRIWNLFYSFSPPS